MRAALGVLCAAATLAAIAPGPAAAASPFRWRGMVEGAYGRPWSHDDRIRMLAWMAQHGFNAYIHTPKNDPYGRANWADPYPPAQQADFDHEIALARARGVQWIPSLSPAISRFATATDGSGQPSPAFCFSCSSDFERVLAKLGRFGADGVRTFMISFDDVRQQLTRPEDQLSYLGSGSEAFGRATADFLDRLDLALRIRYPGARLLTVLATYRGTVQTAYLRGVHERSLTSDVVVLWTGPITRSHSFTPAQASAYGQIVGSQPVVWENWVNNDVRPQYRHKIFLGPYQRNPRVAASVGGFFFDPTNAADLNQLPLATAADWLRDPYRYRARASWLRAVAGLAGQRLYLSEALRAFAETSYGSTLQRVEAPTFRRLARGFLHAYERGGGWGRARRALVHELALTVTARRVLHEVPNPRIAQEARPYLGAGRQAALTGERGAELLAAERPAIAVTATREGFSGRVRTPSRAAAAALRGKFVERARALGASRRFVYGWRATPHLPVPSYPGALPNLMDRFVESVGSLDRRWRTRARRASRRVSLRLAGRRVRLGAHRRFVLRASACRRLLVATDGAGGRTALRLPRCRRR